MISTFSQRLASLVVLFAAAGAQADLVTDNLVYNFGGDNQTAVNWTSSTPASGKADSATRAWTFNGAVATGASGSSATAITTAYTFTGGAGVTTAFADLAPDASFELWIKPASLTGGKQVLLETGGTSKGLSLTLQNGTLWFAIKNNGVGAYNPDIVLASAALTLADIDDYIQVVGVVGGAGTALYVNPVSTANPATAAATNVGGGGWNGGDDAGLAGAQGADYGLGASNQTPGGQWDWASFTTFAGQIGLVRIYDDALSGAEVADNFYATVPEPTTLVLLGAGLLLVTPRRRHA